VRRHDIALIVLEIAGGTALTVERGDKAAVGAADAHGNHPDPLLAAGFGLLLPLAFQILAVGHQNDGLESFAGLAFASLGQQLPGRGQGRSDVRALLGQQFGVGHLQEHVRRAVVQGQRALHERRSREEHEADAALLHAVQEAAELRLGAFEPARRHILRQHRVGDVQHHDDIGTPLRDRHLAGAPLRPRQSDEQPEQAGHEQEAVPPEEERTTVLDMFLRPFAQEPAQPGSPARLPQT